MSKKITKATKVNPFYVVIGTSNQLRKLFTTENIDLTRVKDVIGYFNGIPVLRNQNLELTHKK